MLNPNDDIRDVYNDQPEDTGPINPAASAIKATIIAVIFVTVVFVLYFYFGRPKPESSGAIVKVSGAAMPIQRQTEEGTDIPVTIADQYLAFVQLHITNMSDKPLMIQELNADLEENGNTVPDPKNPNITTTTTKRSNEASPRDIGRLFQLYPQFAQFKSGDPIPTGTTLQPNQSMDGMAIFTFGIDQKEWDLRKGLTVHVNFDNNSSLKLIAP
jgi:hypothetical protein